MRSSGRAKSTQQRARPVLLAQRDLAREREIAVEPGVREHAAVGLDGELPVAVRAHVRERLEPQIRRVGVGARRTRKPPCTGDAAPMRRATRLPPPRTL